MIRDGSRGEEDDESKELNNPSTEASWAGQEQRSASYAETVY
jgi:hypothetical protein